MSLAGSRGGGYTTDGRTLAGDAGSSAVSLIDQGLNRVVVPLPPWSDDWNFWGSGLSALATGGYMFTTVPRAAVLSPVGQLTDEALPAGFIAVSGTSQAGVFVVREDRRDKPESMGDPFTAYFWAIGEDRPTAVMAGVRRAMPSTTGLAWLGQASGGWLLVGANRKAEPAINPEPGWEIEPNPNGSVFVEQTNRSAGCDRDTPPTCRTQLIDRSTHRVLAIYRTGSDSPFRWSGSRVAFIPTRPDPLGPPSHQLVVMNPVGGATEINLPGR